MNLSSSIAKNKPLNYISLGLLAAMAALPFLINRHIPPIPSFWGEALAFSLGLAACLALAGRSAWQPLNFPIAALIPLGLILLVLTQAAAGLAAYPHHHLLVALYLLWAALLMVLGANLRRLLGLQEIATVISWALLAGGLASSLLIFMQMAGISLSGLVMPPVKGYHANLGQVNHMADYLGLGMASLLYLYARRKIATGWILLLAPTLLAALAATGSRASWVYLLLIALLAFIGKRSCPGEAANRLWRAAWLLLPAFFAVQLVLPLLPVERLLMPNQMMALKAAGPSIRMELLRESWTIFQAYPWLGAGFGQFAWQQFLLAFPDTPTNYMGTVEHAHNIVLQLLAEAGIVGALIVVGGAFFWLWRGRKTPVSIERWWLLATLGVLATHAMLEYPLWYAYFLGLAAFLLGLGDEHPLTSRLAGGRWITLLVLVFGAFFLAQTVQQNAMMEGWIKSSVGKKPGAEELARMHGEILGMASRSLLSPYALAVVERGLPVNRDKLNQKLKLNHAVLRYKPNAEAAYKRAMLLALAGDEQEAVLQLKRARAAFPLSKEKQNDFSLEVLKLAIKGEMGMMGLLLELQPAKPE